MYGHNNTAGYALPTDNRPKETNGYVPSFNAKRPITDAYQLRATLVLHIKHSDFDCKHWRRRHFGPIAAAH